MNISLTSWDKLIHHQNGGPTIRQAMDNAADNLSIMIGSTINREVREVVKIPINHIYTHLADPDEELVAVYLLIEGDLVGQALLAFPLLKALQLADVLMGDPVGTTTSFDSLTQSALAEIGNLTLASFLNTLSDATGLSIRPSPPAVVVDMFGAVLDVIAASAIMQGDTIEFIDMGMYDLTYEIEARFWVLPTPPAINMTNDEE